MPHKRNPVLTENLSGLARIIRGNAMAAMENVPLWHERDISHSSVERVIAPDTTVLIDFMLNRLTFVVRNMKVYEEKMLQNLYMSKGLVFSESILIRLVDKGLTREAAYALVQRIILPEVLRGIVQLARPAPLSVTSYVCAPIKCLRGGRQRANQTRGQSAAKNNARLGTSEFQTRIRHSATKPMLYLILSQGRRTIDG